MVDFGIVIPARYGSTRLPGKPLLDIAGKPMIQWVFENAQRAGATFVWVATDDARIKEGVEAFGGEALMTSPDHSTGTDRLAEVVRLRGVPPETIIVNVQGDEPLLPASAIRLAAQSLDDNPSAGIATLAHPIETTEELFNPNVVKVVLDQKGFASYFSRAPIPWVRDAFVNGPPDELPAGIPFLRHVGLYAYRASALTDLARRAPANTERAESLEQLRAIFSQVSIHVTQVDGALPPSVDTAGDLEDVSSALSQGNYSLPSFTGAPSDNHSFSYDARSLASKDIKRLLS